MTEGYFHTEDEALSDVCIYRRTLHSGRVPVKLVGPPPGFLHSNHEKETEEAPSVGIGTDYDILFVVCTNAVEIVQFSYPDLVFSTIDTLMVPFRTRNAATLLVSNWRNACALLVSCEENILLLGKYCCVTKTLIPFRLVKFESPKKDLLGSHLCIDPQG
jgi:hypothetical protein